MSGERTQPRWYCERLPALRASSEAPELVLLHGWANSSEIWRPWLPWLRRRANITLLDLPGSGRTPFQPELPLDELLAQLAQYVPEKAAVLGWSLGGMLAVAFAARYPRQCSAVITIASNACFVAQSDWPQAGSRAAFEQFQMLIDRNAPDRLRRFQALQVHGDVRERELLRELRQMPPNETSSTALHWGLNLLGALDIREALKAVPMPGLHIFGVEDALVPVAAADVVAACVPNHWVVAIAGAAHIPFLSQPDLCWQHMDRALFEARLIKRLPPPVRAKMAVASSFSKAAVTYDEVADLQRQVAAHLQRTLQLSADATVLDIGCGTGAISVQLAQQATVIALDLAEGMLTHAQSTYADANPLHWLCGDAENLPLAGASVDAVFSSLAVQWCENLAAVFAEIARVLRTGGRASIATLGPHTLHELRTAWAAVDALVHVNPFLSRAVVEQAIASAGLQVVQWEEEMVALEYAELRTLTRELKALGAHNVNSGRPTGLTGRERIRTFSAAYATQRNAAGKLPATYQVWYLTLEKAVIEKTATSGNPHHG